MQLGFILSLIFAIIIALFAVMNSEVVTISLIFRQFQMSQSVVILCSAAIGAAIALCLSVFSRIKQMVKVRDFKKQIQSLEEALSKKESLEGIADKPPIAVSTEDLKSETPDKTSASSV